MRISTTVQDTSYQQLGHLLDLQRLKRHTESATLRLSAPKWSRTQTIS